MTRRQKIGCQFGKAQSKLVLEVVVRIWLRWLTSYDYLVVAMDENRTDAKAL